MWSAIPSMVVTSTPARRERGGRAAHRGALVLWCRRAGGGQGLPSALGGAGLPLGWERLIAQGPLLGRAGRQGGGLPSGTEGPWRALARASSSGWPWGGRSGARGPGWRAPATLAWRRPLPVPPVRSLTTWGSVRCLCGQALCLGCLGWAAAVRSLWRWRTELRSTQTCSAGRKAPASSPGCPGDGGHATGHEPVSQGVQGGGAGADTAHGWGGAPRGHGAPRLGCADVEAHSVRGADLEGCGAHGCLRERRRRRWRRGKAIIFVGCPGRLREQGTDATQPWGRE